MVSLSVNELLFYGGLAVMAISAVIAVICTILFICKGRALKKKLEKEYGQLA